MKKLYIIYIINLFLLILNTQASAFCTNAYYNNELTHDVSKKLSKKYAETFKEYSDLNEKMETLEKSKQKDTKLSDKIKSKIEEKELELKKTEEQIASLIGFLDELALGKTVYLAKYEACIEMATLILRSCQDHESMKIYLNTILEDSINNEETKKNLYLNFISEAHLKYSDLYRKLIKDKKKPEQHDAYRKEIFLHNQKAKLLFERMIKNNAINIDCTKKIVPKTLYKFEVDMIESTLLAAVYMIKYCKKCTTIKYEEIEQYRKTAKQYYKDIIKFTSKSEKPNSELIYCKIQAKIKLAIFYSIHKRSKTGDDASLKATLLKLFQEAELTTRENEKLLKKNYLNGSINDLLKITSKNIDILEEPDFELSKISAKNCD